MKVLHVIDSLGLGGGAEHSLVATLPYLDELDVESSIACLYPREVGLFEGVVDDGYSYEVLGGSPISKVIRLRRLVKTLSPDVIHATLVNSCLVSRVSTMGLGIPQINSIVNTTYDPFRTRQLGLSRTKLNVLRVIDGVSAHSVTRFHALTEAVKRDVVENLKVPSDRIRVIPRGRSRAALGERSAQRRDRVRAGLALPVDAFVFLNAARQDSAKAQHLLIEAFDAVASDHPEARLLIAGRRGDSTHLVERAINSAQHADRVQLLGHRTDIADLMCAADAFVFPSHYEGFGGVLLEAMALECPIVASDADALAEVLGHGRLGLIAPRGSATGLSEAMSTLIMHPQRRQALAASALAEFNSKYELAAVAAIIAQEYTALANDDSSSSNAGTSHPG